MPRVISYTRFSSTRQSRGDSYRRQTEMALKWCKEHGLELDTDFILEDLGVSGYSGANARKGSLGVLQIMLLNGEIEPGTVLLIEAFDRLTRLPLPDAYELLFSLVNNGLTIVTLNDGKVWTKEGLKDLGAFMMSMVTLYKGFQESEHKSGRLRETFDQHRKTGSQQAFGTAPGWLSRENKSSPWVVDEEKAEVVRKVFELAAMGYGSKAIAKRANEEKWIVPTRLNKTEGRWHARMPGILLRNRAVLGEHEHRIRTHEAQAQHWKGLATGIVVPDYFPRIVSDELWHRAKASIDTRKVAKRRDTQYFNIWSGLMYCGHCGAPIQRKSTKIGYSKGQHICSDKLAGLTQCPSSAVITADPCLLNEIYVYASAILGTKSGEAFAEEAAALDALIKAKAAESARIAIAIAKTGGSVAALVNKAVEIENEMRAAKEKLEEVQREMALDDANATFDDSFIIDAMSFLYIADDQTAKDKRAALHLKLARLVDYIMLYAYDVALVKYKNVDGFQVVPLMPKRLPSRAKPEQEQQGIEQGQQGAEQGHKPPPPRKQRKPAPQPNLALAWAGELVPPAPKIRAPQLGKAKSYKDSLVYVKEDNSPASVFWPRMDNL
nr:recombinase family protein [uncultured Pseudogulbenkiania sp.]